MNFIYGLLMAWGMFSVIPCPYRGWKEDARGHMLVCFPIIGAIIGAVWFGIFFVSDCLPVYLRSALVSIIPWMLTGFIHLDGFMDVNDAILSRRDLETRQKILKDSRVGAFAVICIGILMMLQFASILSLVEADEAYMGVGLVFIPIVSRICAAFAVMNFRPMSTSQYYDLVKKAGFSIILIIMLIAVFCGLYIGGAGKHIICSAALTGITYFVMAIYGKKILGGMNGDISGYALTISELVGIVGLIL